jgi:hypothetical protein
VNPSSSNASYIRRAFPAHSRHGHSDMPMIVGGIGSAPALSPGVELCRGTAAGPRAESWPAADPAEDRGWLSAGAGVHPGLDSDRWGSRSHHADHPPVMKATPTP